MRKISNYLEKRKEKKQEELIRDEQYDDSSLTQGQKFKRWLRRDAQGLGIALSPIAAGVMIYGAGWTHENVLNRQVTPLVWYDKNNDGIPDAIFAFPIKGTGKAVMRWADGRELAARGHVAPSDYDGFQINAPAIDMSFFDTNALPFKIVSDVYNDPWFARNAYIRESGEEYQNEQYQNAYYNKGYPLEEMLAKPEANDKTKIIVIADGWGITNRLARLE